MTITEPTPLVPSFDETQTDRKLAIICSKGNLDMAYPGLILANAALRGKLWLSTPQVLEQKGTSKVNG